jgi:hypothetical protein
MLRFHGQKFLDKVMKCNTFRQGFAQGSAETPVNATRQRRLSSKGRKALFLCGGVQSYYTVS